MPLTTGTRLGPYEILSAIGAGGMGEVYKARDTKLDRDVAIKILPEIFAVDPERLARFEREAKTLASLNHPNIAQIYGLEESSGVRAIVMELVEGPTLADRIAPGPIPIQDALPIAKQITDALEAAHEQSITHRDLKPANIKVREDGTVKVLDFGLAKVLNPVAQGFSSAAATNAPTMSSPAMMTGAGVILGTAAYMAPEQARGRAADKRADIWAFGVVLYEMLTGRRAFEGEDVSDTLATVLKSEPDWKALPNDVPAPIRTLVQRCLQKDRKQRIADISIAQFLLTEPGSFAAPPSGPVVRSRTIIGWKLAAAGAALVSVVAAPVALIHWRERPADVRPVRFQVDLPDTLSLTSQLPPIEQLAVSPDGRYIAFPASSAEGLRLWVRPLDQLTARALPGTDGATNPIWSPDSRSVAFVAPGKLKRVDVTGGPGQTICDLPPGNFVGGTWNREGVILLGSNSRTTGILRVRASGGNVVEATKREAAEGNHIFPHFLPDGRRFLFSKVVGSTNGIFVGSLDATDTKKVTDDVGPVQLVRGQLLFTRGRSLLAAPFDIGRGEIVGDAVPISDNVNAGGLIRRAAFSASENGVLVFSSSARAMTQFTWVGRTGQPSTSVGTPGPHSTMALAPDEKRVVFGRLDETNGGQNLWVTDLLRNVTTRLTFGSDQDSDGTWSPDGSRIAFASVRQGDKSLYEMPSSGGPERLLLKAPAAQQYSIDDWSPDGRFILFHNVPGELWVLPLDGDHKPVLIVHPASGVVDEPTFSPDGKWVAYNNDESGRSQVYVVPFPTTGARWQISANGGGQPTWRQDGRELFFLAPDGTMMAVDIRAQSNAIEAGTPHVLFKTNLSVTYNLDQYAVSGDGQRFLVMNPLGGTKAAPITVVLNWVQEVER